MKTVTDLPELRPRVVSDPSAIDELRWFQMNRYFESGLLTESPERLPDDPSMAKSSYFGVYRGDEIQATARIVASTDGVLPLMEHHELYPEAQQRLAAATGSVAEIGRLAVGSDTPHYRVLSLLSREFLRFGLRNHHATLLIGSVGWPMIRILNRLLGVPLHVIGPAIDHYGEFYAETVPILIDTVECLNAFRRRESRQWEFYTEGLVIDLTEEHGVALPTCELALATS